MIARPISKADLKRLYIDEGKSCPEIARIVGRNAKRVFEWLRADGVSTRPRGSNSKVHFRSGHKINVGKPRSEATKEKLRDARIADGSAGLFKDGVHVLKGRFGERHPRFKGGLTPERQAFYYSKAWKAAFEHTWSRAGSKCERCDAAYAGVPYSFHVHHIISFEVKKLRAEPSNLVLLCCDCHRFIHSKKNVARKFLGEAA